MKWVFMFMSIVFFFGATNGGTKTNVEFYLKAWVIASILAVITSLL